MGQDRRVFPAQRFPIAADVSLHRTLTMCAQPRGIGVGRRSGRNADATGSAVSGGADGVCAGREWNGETHWG